MHLFHEQNCAGESIALWRSSDLCSLRFPSGVDAKDNVASLLLVDDASAGASAGASRVPSGPTLAVDVYATCRLSEQPTDPMLLETLRAAGCANLHYPLQGHLRLRVGSAAAAAAPGSPADAEADTDATASRVEADLESEL